jgi:hypothetical protein
MVILIIVTGAVFYTENRHKSNTDNSNHDNTHMYTCVQIGTQSPPSAGGVGGPTRDDMYITVNSITPRQRQPGHLWPRVAGA